MPLIVLPAMVTVLLAPIVLVAKVAVAPVVDKVTTSLPAIPLSAAAEVSRRAVADVVES